MGMVAMVEVKLEEKVGLVKMVAVDKTGYLVAVVVVVVAVVVKMEDIFSLLQLVMMVVVVAVVVVVQVVVVDLQPQEDKQVVGALACYSSILHQD